MYLWQNWRVFTEKVRRSLGQCLQARVGILMGKHKTAVTPLLTHWSYCSLALDDLCGPVRNSAYLLLLHCRRHVQKLQIYNVTVMTWLFDMGIRANSRFTPSQWETALLCNDVSHWLGASLESSPGYWRHWLLNRRRFCLLPIWFRKLWQTSLNRVSVLLTLEPFQNGYLYLEEPATLFWFMVHKCFKL